MTNREYLENLTNEELAEFILDEPWGMWCYQEQVDFGGSDVDVLEAWLEKECEW